MLTLRTGAPKFEEAQMSEPFELLSNEEKQIILVAGTKSGLRLHPTRLENIENLMESYSMGPSKTKE